MARAVSADAARRALLHGSCSSNAASLCAVAPPPPRGAQETAGASRKLRKTAGSSFLKAPA
eukprot:15437034-Alexandrium_andersonii.AAC.1